MEQDRRNIDILCVGEVLVDFIGHQTGVLINNTKDYHRYLGGSPANVAMNSARLGLKSVMVATVGKDGFGEYIFERLNEFGVNTDHINTIKTTFLFKYWLLTSIRITGLQVIKEKLF